MAAAFDCRIVGGFLIKGVERIAVCRSPFEGAKRRFAGLGLGVDQLSEINAIFESVERDIAGKREDFQPQRLGGVVVILVWVIRPSRIPAPCPKPTTAASLVGPQTVT